ncbi:MAG: hypothetical protein M3Q10_04955 [Chloroflexota bacterium]|nr:hypothetical protein [Chloroflexota bacterium]
MAERVLLIGASGYRSSPDGPTLDCFPWEQVGKVPNLSDYDTVILNLLSLAAADRVDWTAFSRVLNLHTMAEVLGHDGRIVVLGDPRFTVRRRPATGDETVEEPFLSWSGIEFSWDERAGKSKDWTFDDYRDRHAYGAYLARLTRWDYSLESYEAQTSALVEALGLDQDLFSGKDIRLIVARESFCTSRYRTMLGGALRIKVQRSTRLFDEFRRQVYDDVSALGPLILLPRSDLGEAESLAVILRDACGIEVETPEPAWVLDLEVPGQARIDEDIRRLADEARSLSERLAAKDAARAAVRRRLKLLYEQHQPLEEVVRETLADLGAEVEPPRDPTKEDGWVRVTVGGQLREGVLEIKGTEKGHFTEHGLRQLSEWVDRGIDREEKVYKGIFVGNAAVATPPDKRPVPFGQNMANGARLRKFVLIRSEDLYLAYGLKTLGLLDTEQFWRAVFDTDGVFDATHFRAARPSST